MTAYLAKTTNPLLKRNRSKANPAKIVNLLSSALLKGEIQILQTVKLGLKGDEIVIQ